MKFIILLLGIILISSYFSKNFIKVKSKSIQSEDLTWNFYHSEISPKPFTSCPVKMKYVTETCTLKAEALAAGHLVIDLTVDEDKEFDKDIQDDIDNGTLDPSNLKLPKKDKGKPENQPDSEKGKPDEDDKDKDNVTVKAPMQIGLPSKPGNIVPINASEKNANANSNGGNANSNGNFSEKNDNANSNSNGNNANANNSNDIHSNSNSQENSEKKNKTNLKNKITMRFMQAKKSQIVSELAQEYVVNKVGNKIKAILGNNNNTSAVAAPVVASAQNTPNPSTPSAQLVAPTAAPVAAPISSQAPGLNKTAPMPTPGNTGGSPANKPQENGNNPVPIEPQEGKENSNSNANGQGNSNDNGNSKKKR